MKVRTGFVSNSSTSSFCIFGAEFDLETLKEVLREPNRKNIKAEKEKRITKAQDAYGKVPPEEYLRLKALADENLEEKNDDNFYDQLNGLMVKFGLAYYDQSGDGENFCIGRNFTDRRGGRSGSGMKDDETKKQFQDSVRSKLSEMCGKKIECDVIEGEYAT